MPLFSGKSLARAEYKFPRPMRPVGSHVNKAQLGSQTKVCKRAGGTWELEGVHTATASRCSGLNGRCGGCELVAERHTAVVVAQRAMRALIAEHGTRGPFFDAARLERKISFFVRGWADGWTARAVAVNPQKFWRSGGQGLGRMTGIRASGRRWVAGLRII
jgi:hypothetical protein